MKKWDKMSFMKYYMIQIQLKLVIYILSYHWWRSYRNPMKTFSSFIIGYKVVYAKDVKYDYLYTLLLHIIYIIIGMKYF